MPMYMCKNHGACNIDTPSLIPPTPGDLGVVDNGAKSTCLVRHRSIFSRGEMAISRYSVVCDIRSGCSTALSYRPPLSRCLILPDVSVTERSGTPSRRSVPPAVPKSSTSYVPSRWRQPQPRGRRNSRPRPNNDGFFGRDWSFLSRLFFFLLSCFLCSSVFVVFPFISEISRMHTFRKTFGWCRIFCSSPPYFVFL